MNGCATVTIARPAKGVFLIEQPELNGSLSVTKPNKMEVDAEIVETEVSVSTERIGAMSLTISLICSVGKGIAVLCGSDGALITLDGEYIIVRGGGRQ